MMTPRQLVRRALDHASPPRVPRQAWITPWAERHHPADVARLRAEFPDDIATAPASYRTPLPIVGHPYRKGLYVDEWGCRFDNPYDGLLGRALEPPIRRWSDLESFHPPAGLLDLDRDAIDRFCASTDRFVLAGAPVRLFERLCLLRAMEGALADLLERPPGLGVLLDLLRRHARAEVAAWAATDVDAIVIADDWGGEDRLLVSPDTWRQAFKPLYRELCATARQAGKFVFMHSDGWILDIVPDLVEIGVQALNCQVARMGAPALGRFRGRLTFWGEIDRHAVLAHGSADDVRHAVREACDHLSARGGVIAQCEFGPGARPENVIEVFRAWQACGASG